MENINHKSINSFQIVKKINEGAYGEVYKAITKDTKTIVALKKIKKKYVEEIIDHITLREVSILRDLNHPNIIRLFEIIIDKDDIYLVYEFMDMDLHNFIYKSQFTITKTLLKDILYKILNGLEYLHEKCIMHRDLKLRNILISKDGQCVKIADFGLSRKLNIINPNYSKKTGTVNYMAPEILLNFSDYSIGIDVWSVACIFYEISFKKKLFEGSNYVDQLHEIEIVLGTPKNKDWDNIESHEKYQEIYPKNVKGIINKKLKGLNSKAIDLLKQMLVYDPKKRINVKKALSHVSLYFYNIEKLRIILKKKNND